MNRIRARLDHLAHHPVGLSIFPAFCHNAKQTAAKLDTWRGFSKSGAAEQSGRSTHQDEGHE